MKEGKKLPLRSFCRSSKHISFLSIPLTFTNYFLSQETRLVLIKKKKNPERLSIYRPVPLPKLPSPNQGNMFMKIKSPPPGHSSLSVSKHPHNYRKQTRGS